MTRPLRIDIDNGWYHITARGQNRQAIFLDDRDRHHFLDLLGELSERFGVQIHAYVLMGNHYHLLIRTPRANASRALQWLNVSYSLWWNRRHERSGHVFQGRFKSVLVEDGEWVLELSRYLHFNPVAVKKLGMGKERKAVERLGLLEPTRELVRARLKVLRTYRWSSYRAYAGYAAKSPWLVTNVILNQAGNGRGGYRRWAEAQLHGGQAENPWHGVKWGMVLGAEAFAERIRRKLKPGRDHERRGELRDITSWPQIVHFVEKERGMKWEEMIDRHGEWGRELAWWAGRRYGGLTLKELGRRAGGVDYTAVAMALRRLGERAATEPSIAAAQKRLAANCEK